MRTPRSDYGIGASRLAMYLLSNSGRERRQAGVRLHRHASDQVKSRGNRTCGDFYSNARECDENRGSKGSAGKEKGRSRRRSRDRLSRQSAPTCYIGMLLCI